MGGIRRRFSFSACHGSGDAACATRSWTTRPAGGKSASRLSSTTGNPRRASLSPIPAPTSRGRYEQAVYSRPSAGPSSADSHPVTDVLRDDLDHRVRRPTFEAPWRTADVPSCGTAGRAAVLLAPRSRCSGCKRRSIDSSGRTLGAATSSTSTAMIRFASTSSEIVKPSTSTTAPVPVWRRDGGCAVRWMPTVSVARGRGRLRAVGQMHSCPPVWLGSAITADTGRGRQVSCRRDC